MSDDAHLARAYLDGLLRAWPSCGGPRRPARSWRAAAFAYAAIGALGATACAGEALGDDMDAGSFDSGAQEDTGDADLVDSFVDESPTAIAMYAAPGTMCSTTHQAPASEGLLLGFAAVAWCLRRRR